MSKPVTHQSVFSKLRTRLAVGMAACVIAACSTPGLRAPGSASGNALEAVFIQMNDVYEILPIHAGKSGGLARVATVKNELKRRNPNTFMILAGDFLSPSALGTAKSGGKALAGKQVVSTLNTAGLDLAVFGNHEFDVSKEALDERIAERRFIWISGNVRDADGKPYGGLPEAHVFEISSPDGRKARIGIVSATIDSNRKDHVRYLDPIASLKAQVQSLQKREEKPDAIIAITHLAIATDVRVAREVPGIDLIMGGHEHEKILLREGERTVPIAKADANAKTVYIHVLKFEPDSPVSIDSFYREIDESVEEEPDTARVAAHWTRLAFDSFRAEGLDPEEELGRLSTALDGRDSSIRNHPTGLTDLVLESMLADAPDADLAFFNAGGIRIDDIIQPGPLTVYDVIRIMPFKDRLVTASIRGDRLRRLLDRGAARKGSGGFGLSRWKAPAGPIEDARVYRLITTDYVLKRTPVRDLKSGGDLRSAIIRHLKRILPTGA